MKRVFFSSIRFKVFVLYVGVLVLALFFFNFLSYLSFKEEQERKIDSLLSAKAEAVESALHAYRQAQRTPGTNWFADLFGTASAAPHDPYDTVIRYLAQDVLSPNPADLRIFIDVFDLNGNLIDSSHRDNRIQSLNREVLDRVLAGQKVFYKYHYPGKKAERIPIRAMAMPLDKDGRIEEIVQTRVPLTHVYNQLLGLVFQLTLRSLVVIALASWGSFFLVQSTLKPVDKITQTIRKIRTENLDQRIQVPETADEIARLAETSNALLERLDKSFRSQRQIVQDISHELKTPLTIIRGQIEVVLKKKRSTEEYEEVIQSALEEIEKVRKIIDNLLLLAKFDQPGHGLEMRTLSLNQIQDSVVQDTRILSREKGLQVTCNAAEDVHVYGNEVHLDRLFRNLLENAVKYNVPKGRIHVSVDKGKNMARVMVEDTGIGMSLPDTGKVFDRFYRANKARSSGEGFGLGLSIVKSIVDAHRGQINVKSEPGKGSVFYVWLPVTAFDHYFSN